MKNLVALDQFDWHGCTVVRYDSEKLGGKATVLETRLDADTVLLNHRSGMSAEEIAEDFGTDLQAIRTVLAFAHAKHLRAIA